MIFLRLFFVGLFIFGSVYFLVKKNTLTPRIFVLHSYASDYSWTRDVDVGIKKIFEKDNNITVKWHYMNSKNYPEESHLKKVGKVVNK